MFCGKCGQELSENARFCGGCGAAVTQQGAAAVKKQKKEKKRTPIWLSLLVMAIFYLLGRFLVAPAMAEGLVSEEPEYQTEYCRLLYSRNIDAAPKEFEDQSLDYFALASVDDAEIVDRMEFGYKKDSVRELINTVYYPISDLDENQIATLDGAMREVFDKYAGDGFCSVVYEIGKEHYIVTIHFTGLDSVDNVRRLAELGYAEEGAERLSAKQSMLSLTFNGYEFAVRAHIEEDQILYQQLPNREYKELFSSRGIAEIPTRFAGLDSMAFAAALDGDVLERLEYAYKDDIVYEMVDTVYFPLSNMDDSQKESMISFVKGNYDGYSEAGFCDVSYRVDEDWCTVTLRLSGLDTHENLLKMMEIGLVEDNSEIDYLSVGKTVTNLSSMGYVMK